MGIDMQIIFDNPSCTYHPGQTVSGNLHVTTTEQTKIRSICIKFKGAANTKWKVNRPYRDIESTWKENVKGNEHYFDSAYYVVGSSTAEPSFISGGLHVYSFACSLPQNLPSSFEGKHGHIRYTVKAELERPLKFDYKVVRAFTIVSPLDLNLELQASDPIYFTKTKKFYCLRGPSESLTMHISLPVKGYVPGQNIPVKVNVENHSKVPINNIKLSLIKKILFIANRPFNEVIQTKHLITEVRRGPFSGNCETEYVQDIKIPPLPPSKLNPCRIIELTYYLKMKAHTAGIIGQNVSEKCEILIGTIPLKNYQLPVPLSQQNSRTSNGLASSSTSTYSEIGPPTYEESTMFMTQTLQEHEDPDVSGANLSFSPRYPVYNFFTP